MKIQKKNKVIYEERKLRKN